MMAGGQPPLLLDLYPNAASAYSLRKLRTAYTGSAIRVRRSSDNAEQDIGFMGINLDTTALTTFCGVGNGLVTTWYDQSGNFRNATQSSATFQPQIVSSGNVILKNGTPSIQFDGTNDSFDRIITGVNLRSFYFVGEVAANEQNPPVFWGSLGGVGNSFGSFLLFGNATGSLAGESISFYNGNSGTAPATFNSTNYGTINQEQILLSAYFNTGANGKIFVNNNNANMIANDYGIRTLDYQIGKRINLASYYNLKMQEIIMYSTEESANNSGINNNIKTYFGIP
jgi:hypothetical protein